MGSFSEVALATTNTDDLNIAGTFICNGYDMHDGAYQNAKLTLSLDAKDSDFSNNYGTYRVKLIDGEAIYIGEAAASGNTIAIYFQNTASSMLTDRGVVIAAIVHDKDANGKIATAFHKFYYEPAYHGGGNGYETCVKQSG